MKLNILVSACLLGQKCRYDGGSKPVPELDEFNTNFQLVPFCPETLGGLTIPRPPAEILGGDGVGVLAGTAFVFDATGRNYSIEFIQGAKLTVALFHQIQPRMVIVKANSPSCGLGRIYDGSFSGTLRDGDGVAVALLRQAGAKLFTEKELTDAKLWLDS